MQTQPILLLARSFKNLRALHRKERWAAWLALMPILNPFQWRRMLMAQAAHEKEVKYTITEQLARRSLLDYTVKPQP
jgi:hypothetical protein